MRKASKPPMCMKSPIGGQFKATNIWKDLVNHLYENANVKRRRVMMKAHNNCFSGSNAVDTLLSYVQTNPSRFPNTNTVTRENIVRLCQSFLDAYVFECVNAGDDTDRKTKFEDSTSRLYRFIWENRSQFDDDSQPTSSSVCRNREMTTDSAKDVESLPAKFRSLTTTSLRTDSALKHRTAFSPFNGRGRKKSVPVRSMSVLHASDSDSENKRPSSARRSPRLKRRASFVGAMMKRSSSDSNMQKDASSGSACESEPKRQSPGEHLSRGMLRLSQRLSLRKRNFRRSSQSTFNLEQSCVIQNAAADEEPDIRGAFMRRDFRRRSGKSTVPSDACDKVKVLSSRPREKKLTAQETSHVKRESVRVRLLQIFDLPFVETLVISPTFDKKMLTSDERQRINRYSGMNYSEVASAYDNKDSWVFNALTVLQHIPNSYNILKKFAKLPSEKKKSQLYFAIADYYGSLPRPLFDENYNPIAMAIIDLLESKPVEKIIEPMQLFVHLLPDARLTELRHLCMFLHAVCNQKQIKLLQEGSNQAAVISAFTSAILRVAEPTHLNSGFDGVKGLVRFTIHHHLRVFMLPASIEMMIRRKVDLLEQGDIDSPSVVPDSTYCPQMTKAEYNEQKEDFTQKEVFSLYKNIEEDSRLTAKKKKDLLKKLARQHPNIFQSTNASTGKSSTKDGKDLAKQNRKRSKKRSPVTRSKTIDTDINFASILSTKGSARKTTPTSKLSLSAKVPPPSTDPLARRRSSSARGEVFV